MKMFAALLVTLLMTSVAQATPGDIGCEGKTADGRGIDVLIGYDNFGEGPSLLEVTVGDKKIFSSTDVKESLLSLGSEGSQFMASEIKATDLATKSGALIIFPEQEVSPDGSYLGDLSLTVDHKEILTNAEIQCQR